MVSISQTIIQQHALIVALATAELKLSPYHEVHKVLCFMDEGTLVLTGNVPTFFHKQIAQSQLLTKLDGCVLLENRITVCM